MPRATDAGSTPRRASVRALLRDPVLGPLARAELVSSLGGAMVGLAIVYVSYDTSKSIFHTVLVTAAYTLPSAFLAPMAGRLAQHRSRRQIVLVSYAAKMALYAAMAMVGVVGSLDATILLLFALPSGAISAITYPAWTAFERDVIPPDELDEANALLSSMASVAQLVGILTSGLLISLVGADAVFVLNALSYIPELVVLARMHPEEHPVDTRDVPRFGEALAFIRVTPRLREAMVTLAAASLLAAPVASLMPAIAADAGRSASALAVFSAVFALGSALVASVVIRLRDTLDRSQMLEVAMVLAAILLVSFGVTRALFADLSLSITVGLVLVLVGLMISMAQSVLLAITQVHTPDRMVGEVLAVYGMIYSVLAPLGALALSALAERIDVLYTLALSGVALAICAAILHRRHVRLGESLPSPLLIERAAKNLHRRAHPTTLAASATHHAPAASAPNSGDRRSEPPD